MTTPSNALMLRAPPELMAERMAVAGFLAGYTGSTCVGYATDLRIFTHWLNQHGLGLFDVQRAHLELFARSMEADGKMRSTVARRLSTLCSCYRSCHVEGLSDRNPAANVRRPKVDYESRTQGLDRNELGALLVQAGLSSARDHALITLLAMNGLRISEALGANVEDMDAERGHRTMRVLRKGHKRVTIPLAPRTGRALDLYVGERGSGPIFLGVNGLRIHHRRPRCRRAAARCPGSGESPRSENDDALRPSTPKPRPARHLRRRRLHRRRRTELSCSRSTSVGGASGHRPARLECAVRQRAARACSEPSNSS